MLDAEEARVRLQALRNERWQEDARKRIGALKRAHRSLAAVMLEEYPPYREDHARRDMERRLNAAGAVLDGLTDADRTAVMRALHPKLGQVLARWWVDAQKQPYIFGWTRKAFRAPNNPEITRRSRVEMLRTVMVRVGPYDGDATWLAAWAPYLGTEYGGYGMGFAPIFAGGLLAAAVDSGGDTGDSVLEALIQIGNGDHPIGVMDRHVIVGLLGASRREGWEFVERMLLAAQRQEGLRQAILESVDEAHPEAFDRFLALMVEHNLIRFAATVRAVCVWLGFEADVEQIPLVAERVETLRRMRADADGRRVALVGDDPWDAYIALCAQAMRDVVPTLSVAETAIRHPSPDIRAAVVRFLAAVTLPAAAPLLVRALEDPDLGVAVLAHSVLGYAFEGDPPPDAFDRLEALARRLPERGRTAPPLGVEQRPITLSRAAVVGSLLSARGRRPLTALLPWVPAMDAATRQLFAMKAGEMKRLDADLRAVLVTMVGDRSPLVRGAAVRAMERLRVEPSEATALEVLLTRKAGDLRRGVIGLLAKQPVTDAVRSAERLWAAGDEAQRDAACELLGAMPSRPDDAVATARRFALDAPTERQQELLDEVVGISGVAGSDDLGLGLFDPSRRAPVRPPKAIAVRMVTDVTRGILSGLDDLVHEHRDTTFTVMTWQGSADVLLADARFLPSPFALAPQYGPAEQEGQGLILPELFRGWWADRPSACREDDALDALRALTAVGATGGHDWFPRYYRGENEWWARLLDKLLGGSIGELRYAPVVHHVLSWLLADDAKPAVVDASLDFLEATLANIPGKVLRATPKPDAHRYWAAEGEWRQLVDHHPSLGILNGFLAIQPGLFDRDRIARWFGVMRWLDEPRPGVERHVVSRPLLLSAHDAGVATDDDVLDGLLQLQSRLLMDFTRRRRGQLEERHPRVVVLADRVRARVLEIERARGELATAASPVTGAISSISGHAVELLGRLGRASLVRGWTGDYNGREVVFSRLIRCSYPEENDTGESVRAAAAAAGVSDRRLIDLAVYAPQWASLVEEALGWTGLEDAVWWFHAHTKDDQWMVDPEVRETWAALSAERTPLTGEDLVAGAVDVEWFHRSRTTLGASRWKSVHAAAKLASGGNGHRRAQLFAEAMDGGVDEAALLKRITEKRHQDSVRALGLLPLPERADEREAITLRRYGTLREFERGSSKFGSQRQTSERTAVRIGIENLARSAGMVDAQRFVWAMEAAEAGELAHGPVTVEAGDVSVTLSVSPEGAPELSVRRGEKALKAVPATHRKDPQVAALRDRKTALTRQASRVRKALEAAMVRQDEFAPDDLAKLDDHPVVAPMLELLVFVGDTGQTVRRRRGGRFVGADGRPVDVRSALRIAHPVDLRASGTWVAWQEQLFVDEQRQPFKQAFRELYVVTDAERTGGPLSRRYEGHQVQPRQAAALLGQRGWLVDRENGDVSRVFHRHDLVARLEFLDGFLTPAEVELPTIDRVLFTRRGDRFALPLDSVSPVVFSEAMRDLDLVVSVAHAGGVDPEATASTVDMRGALVRETARLLKLENVRAVNSHVVIEGALGEYSVHLGSGVVHRRPGGAVCIIPVDSQRRGRIFLPFADDDPKTAEVVAKVLLLARDKQIKDPSILQQLRS